jgi:hypothetical protein
MNLPNLGVFASLFGGQMVAALNASARKCQKEVKRANGQTVRGLPNMVLQAHTGDKFYLQGIVCALNGWSDIELSTAVKEGDVRADGTIVMKGDATNRYGVVPFNWKGDAGSDSRCDAMRQFCREACEYVDEDSGVHFEEAPKEAPARKSKAPSINSLVALGLA